MHNLRKVLAVLSALTGLFLLLRPAPPTTTVLLTTRDLPPGVPLAKEDVRTTEIPATLAPPGAATPTSAEGRTLGSPAGAGEILTDARLTTADPDTATVAVKPTDPAVLTLLKPGGRVDVVTETGVLAENATVIAVHDNTVVVLSTDATTAARVATESLTHPLAVTVH
ncbi:hypothetical protein GCM10022243_11130 [Saccharothrix violaceirubra]|uniref:Flp pilus assembly protein CpaB n=1 Tax=Saccharothrix violaceirubra TaxID=413306 RepID=A0A7W7WYM7_9PSEU|nr:SAF domain-containing protein [Saccharothrix violaceirubra]MBB4968615.1 Flp pilus assembly protein CpaB [Saccharothrix violaceirubra]